MRYSDKDFVHKHHESILTDDEIATLVGTLLGSDLTDAHCCFTCGYCGIDSKCISLTVRCENPRVKESLVPFYKVCALYK